MSTKILALIFRQLLIQVDQKEYLVIFMKINPIMSLVLIIQCRIIQLLFKTL
jgi:hypothetical protein